MKNTKISGHLFRFFFDFLFQILSRTWGINFDTIACLFELVYGPKKNPSFSTFFFIKKIVPDLGDQFWYNRLSIWAGLRFEKTFFSTKILFPQTFFLKRLFHHFPAPRSDHFVEIFFFHIFLNIFKCGFFFLLNSDVWLFSAFYARNFPKFSFFPKDFQFFQILSKKNLLALLT